MKLIKSILFTSIFISSAVSAQSTLEQIAYNECLGHVTFYESIQDFSRLSPKKQATHCIDLLAKSFPKTYNQLPLESFRRGFFDGRFRQH